MTKYSGMSKRSQHLAELFFAGLAQRPYDRMRHAGGAAAGHPLATGVEGTEGGKPIRRGVANRFIRGIALARFDQPAHLGQFLPETEAREHAVVVGQEGVI